MKKSIDEVKAQEAGLTRTSIEVYVPVTTEAENKGREFKIAVSGKAQTGLSDAERQRKHKAKLAERGLAQFNVVLPISPQIRSLMSAFAGRVAATSDWEKAVAAEPFVKRMQLELDSLKVKLLRLDDLDERHRRTRTILEFHSALMSTTGVKKYLLRLAGVNFYPPRIEN